MNFHRAIAPACLLLGLTVFSQSVRAEEKKSTTSAPVVRAAPAPVVRAAPAPAPVVRAPAPAPVVRAAPAPAPVVRAPATTTATRPAPAAATATVKPAAAATVKPVATATVKPAAAATVKPAAAATVKPAATATVKPAATAAATPSAMDRSRNRIQSELPADGAVRADPAKKPSMEGVRASEFQPRVKLKPLAGPPAPGQPNFPKRSPNDPAPTNPLNR
jgi:hypothetical protein